MAHWKQNAYTFHVTANNETKTVRLHDGFESDFKTHDGVAAAPRITIPTLIVHGDADTRVSIEQSKQTAALLQNGRLQIVHGADHTFSNETQHQQMTQHICAFILEQNKRAQ